MISRPCKGRILIARGFNPGCKKEESRFGGIFAIKSKNCDKT